MASLRHQPRKCDRLSRNDQSDKKPEENRPRDQGLAPHGCENELKRKIPNVDDVAVAKPMSLERATFNKGQRAVPGLHDPPLPGRDPHREMGIEDPRPIEGKAGGG